MPIEKITVAKTDAQIKSGLETAIDRADEIARLEGLDTALTTAGKSTAEFVDKVVDLSKLSSSASEIDSSVINKEKLKFIRNILASSVSCAIVGDSISHGAFATNIKNNSYVGLLKNYFNNIFNSKNYGFETIAASNTDGIWNSTLIHGMYTVGTWTTPADDSVWSLNGNEKWGVATSQMFFELDDLKNQKYFKLNILKSVTSGSNYSIYVNNVLKETAGTSATNNVIQNAYSPTIQLVDDGNNHCIIKVVINSGELGICGVTYSASSNPLDFTLNNYSHSGRKASNVNEYVISNIMSNNKVVFWNLGHNDSGLSDLTKFNQVMGWVYQYAIANKTVVIFSDFLWTHSLNNPVRLKNIETSNDLGKQSFYIMISPSLTIDGTIPTETYLTTTISSWADISHPNDKGHRILFSMIKNELGF